MCVRRLVCAHRRDPDKHAAATAKNSMNRRLGWPRAELKWNCSVTKRHNVAMRVERVRENVFTVRATGQELSALVADARMALEAMRAAAERPAAEAVEGLERALGDFDRARDRLTEGGAAGG